MLFIYSISYFHFIRFIILYTLKLITLSRVDGKRRRLDDCLCVDLDKIYLNDDVSKDLIVCKTHQLSTVCNSPNVKDGNCL